jgi:hypothetical protein
VAGAGGFIVLRGGAAGARGPSWLSVFPVALPAAHQQVQRMKAERYNILPLPAGGG